MLSPSTDRLRWSRGALLVAFLMALGGFQPALAQDAGPASAPQEQKPGTTEGEKAAEGEESATEEQIRAAHKRLILQTHPDKGGTNYLAAKINEAKDRILGKHR